MSSIDRPLLAGPLLAGPLLAGLLCGLLACAALPGLVTSSAYADEGEHELRRRIPIELQERIELAIEEAKEELNRGPIGPPPPQQQRESRDQPRVQILLERQEREIRRSSEERQRESQHRERERDEREHMEREHMEREHRERQPMEREQTEREQMEREQMEREHQQRREHEERERAQQDRALDHELRSLEIRRQHIELRVAEMELQERVDRSQSRSTAQSNDVAFDAIKTAVLHMEPAAAAEFFADMLDDVKSHPVKNQLRMQLAKLYFETDQPDKATKQLRMLIAP